MHINSLNKFKILFNFIVPLILSLLSLFLIIKYDAKKKLAKKLENIKTEKFIKDSENEINVIY